MLLRDWLSRDLVSRARDEQWSLDSRAWRAVENGKSSVTVEGLRDGVHSLTLKHDYDADGRDERENADYT